MAAQPSVCLCAGSVLQREWVRLEERRSGLTGTETVPYRYRAAAIWARSQRSRHVQSSSPSPPPCSRPSSRSGASWLFRRVRFTAGAAGDPGAGGSGDGACVDRHRGQISTLTQEQVTAVLAGRTVQALARDIQEVKNYSGDAFELHPREIAGGSGYLQPARR